VVNIFIRLFSKSNTLRLTLLDQEDNFSLVYIVISLGLILTITKSLILNPIFDIVSFVCFYLNYKLSF